MPREGTLVVKQTNDKEQTMASMGRKKETHHHDRVEGKPWEHSRSMGSCSSNGESCSVRKRRRKVSRGRGRTRREIQLTFHPGRLRAISGCFLSIAS